MAVNYWYIIRDLKQWNACFNDQGVGTDTKWGNLIHKGLYNHGFELLEDHPAIEGALIVKIKIEEDGIEDRIRIVNEYLYSLREIEDEKI